MTVIYRVSQEECAKLRESVPYVKVYRYNPKHELANKHTFTAIPRQQINRIQGVPGGMCLTAGECSLC